MMKKKIYLLCLVSISLFLNKSIYGQSLNALDKNNGFKSYKFGAQIDSFKNCDFKQAHYSDRGAEKCIMNKRYQINDITIGKVVLYFVDSKLSKIKAIPEVFYSPSEFSTAIKGAFGEPNLFKQHNSLGSVRSDCWKAHTVTLCHQYSSSIGGTVSIPKTYHISFELNNYDELLEKYRSKKYTPADFE